MYIIYIMLQSLSPLPDDYIFYRSHFVKLARILIIFFSIDFSKIILYYDVYLYAAYI